MDWNKAVETYKDDFHLKNDSRLAAHLGITRSAISKYKNGNSWPIATKIKILDRKGYAWTMSALASVLPENVAKKVLKASQARTDKIVDDYVNERFNSFRVSCIQLRAAGVTHEELEDELNKINDKIESE